VVDSKHVSNPLITGKPI